MYLAQYVSGSGVCSRRKAIECIKAGLVEVNGSSSVDVNYQVKPGDVIKYQDKILRLEKKVYISLNKPTGYVTTCSDEKGRKTVLDLVKEAKKLRLYPVGRLDMNTTGLLFLTNDGDLAQKLAHPKYAIKKVYHVTLDQSLKIKDLITIKKGEVVLWDGRVVVNKIFFKSSKSKKHLVVEIHSGKKRIIRRLFNHLGYNVVELDRVAYGSLTKKGLPVGIWRFLTKKEILELHKK